MAEKLTLTVPETKPSNTDYKVDRLTIDVSAGILHVQLLGANSEALSKVYNSGTTPTGMSLIVSLNKANLSVKSLQRRVLEQLISDGVLAGTITGSPD